MTQIHDTVDGQEAVIDGTVPRPLIDPIVLTLPEALEALAGAELVARQAHMVLATAKENAKQADLIVARAFNDMRDAAERECNPDLFDAHGTRRA